MPLPRRDDHPNETHDRCVVYCCVAKAEVVVDMDAQEARAREDAAEHDAQVVAVVREELGRRPGSPLERPGLLGALRKVRSLAHRGVLLAAMPSRFGSTYDVAALCAVLEDSGGALVTVEPLCAERFDRALLFRLADTLASYERILKDFRQQDDAVVLRRALAWPPGSDTDQVE